MRSILLPTALLIGLWVGGNAASAQPQSSVQTPASLACTATNNGQSACQAEGVCRCEYDAGGLMHSEPPGYRWNCSLNYGKCTVGSDYPVLASLVPATIKGGSRQIVDRSRIAAAQRALLARGYAPGAADGVTGQRTRAALKAFQADQGLAVSGALDASTEVALSHS